MTSLLHVQGDLFNAPEDFSLAHCVSRDLKMGKGIAVLFRERFGRVEELRSQNPEVGGVVYLQLPGRCVFYLVTKEKYFQKPSYESLEKSLFTLKALCESLNLYKLAMPRLGCGLDNLNWSIVESLLDSTFPETFSLLIYSYNIALP
jgi:hypothetical protein